MRSIISRIPFILTIAAMCLAMPALAQIGGPAVAAPELDDDGLLAAPVVVDGKVLIRVRGISPDPAVRRAERIHDQIVRIASDETVDPSSGRLQRSGNQVAIIFGGNTALVLYQADAELENVELDVLAEAALTRIATAITDYRNVRSTAPLARSTGILAGITLVAVLLIFAVIKLFGWFNRLIESRVRNQIDSLERASHRIIDASQLWTWFGGLIKLLRTLTLLTLGVVWLNTALSIYPWTRPFASSVFKLVLDPLNAIGVGIFNALPDIAFLIILVFVVRFILRIAHTFFDRVGRGWIRLESFDREWALPTYRIVRILIVAFALVVAYPYIPGSGSDAFKGVSLFLGVVFSIGSSSFIANIIAGYSLTYRRAFRIGDRVQIGDLVGDVVETRVLSTRLRSVKNEEINIPNLEVLSSHVINFSSMQKEHGLILHTQVGIGYDVPWRQVEALLLLAAERTDGLKDDPPPFVQQRQLNDFAVQYELNAYSDDPKDMNAVYSALHANIQDAFNEYGVQIMSPNYDRDPDTPKLVPKENWFESPAVKPAE